MPFACQNAQARLIPVYRVDAPYTHACVVRSRCNDGRVHRRRHQIIDILDGE